MASGKDSMRDIQNSRQKMVRLYAITIGLLLGFLGLVTRRVALAAYACLMQVRGAPPVLPPFTRFIYFIAPQAWLIPLALLLAVALFWNREVKWTLYAAGAATVVFLVCLCLCAIGFIMPFIPTLCGPAP